MKNNKLNYVENLNFGLKDFDKTFNKYRFYKQKEFKTFLDNNKEDLNFHLEDLYYRIENKLIDKLVFFTWININQKTGIKHLKTLINSLTYELNKDFLKDFNLKNDNTLKNFAIMFYLNFYKRINNTMKEVLKEYCINNWNCDKCFYIKSNIKNLCSNCNNSMVIEKL
jgi:hypothetical protein|tara:strand:- start:1001 stop:1504 length:504 start_codon:yes stop_codon:yes gene_type:complete